MHSYGIAFDIDNERYLSRQMKSWIAQHPKVWDNILRKNHMVQYMPSFDAPHIEWVGPQSSHVARR